MSVQFLHTLLLWGSGLLVLPILIHLLRRRRMKIIRLPTFEFLLRTQRRITRRSRLRNWLLLALRISAVAVVVLLAARPFFLRGGGPVSGSWSPQHLIVILDNSASMGYQTANGTRFAVAKRAAERMIQELSGADKVTLLPTVPLLPDDQTALGLSPEKALAALDAIGQTDGAGRPVPALRRALEGFPVSADRRNIVVFSDFSRGEWEDMRLRGLRRLNPHMGLQFVRVAPEAGVDNLAIRTVSFRPWPPRAGGPIAAVVRLRNQSSRKREQVPVEVFVEDKKVASAKVDIAAGGEGEVSFRIRAPREGVFQGRVEVAAEKLPATNVHYFSAWMGRRLRALVIDGDPNTGLSESESFYMTHALRAASSGGDSPFLVHVAAHFELEKLDWGAFDLVVGCNVAGWSPDVIQKLRQFVDDGGGFLLAGGDLAGKAIPGAGWLPAEVGAPLLLEEPQGVALEPRSLHHPVFASLGEHPEMLFRKVRARRASALQPARGGVVLLRLSGGAPLLVLGSSGAGKVAVWGLTCDRDWSDIPVRPVFVPLLRGLAVHLGGKSQNRGTVASAGAGHPFEIFTRPGSAGRSVRIQTPAGLEHTLPLGGASASGRPEEGGRALVTRFARTEKAGIYRILGPGGEEVAAVNVPADEADMAPMGDAEMRRRLAGLNLTIRALPAASQAPLASLAGRMDLGMVLFVLLAGVLVCEGVVADRS